MRTTHDLFEWYGRRFAAAMAALPLRDPARPDDRAAIQQRARECIGVRAEWIPQITIMSTKQISQDGLRIDHLHFTSWPGVHGAAHLYAPDTAGEAPLPLVVLCCGHGDRGKLSAGYQAMARAVARRGARVLVPDNIGQGERQPMGHRNPVAPFACGMSVQGLIVMETMAWVRWAARQPFVDASRLAAIGNSGGGTLTLFLAALCPELAVLSSSGYPSTFDFVARKEKKHCHCNVLPGVVGSIEMWHVLGCFAAKPMLLFQGHSDNIFPRDLFHYVEARVRGVYARLGAVDRIETRVLPGDHSWDEARIRLVADFLSRRLDLAVKESPAGEGALDAEALSCLERWPEDAVDTDTLAQRLTGISVRSGIEMWDVFPPETHGLAMLEDVTPRGPTRQILAQFEAWLGRPPVTPPPL